MHYYVYFIETELFVVYVVYLKHVYIVFNSLENGCN